MFKFNNYNKEIHHNIKVNNSHIRRVTWSLLPSSQCYIIKSCN